MGLWSRCIVDGFVDGDDEVMREEKETLRGGGKKVR